MYAASHRVKFTRTTLVSRGRRVDASEVPAQHSYQFFEITRVDEANFGFDRAEAKTEEQQQLSVLVLPTGPARTFSCSFL